MLHTLFDYSHPRLLGGKDHSHHSPRIRSPGGTPPKQGAIISSRGDGGDGDGDGDGDIDAVAVTGSSLGWEGGHGHGRASNRVTVTRRALGRRLPRCLVVHGTADATVPFSQTAAVGAALKTLGVPTVVRYDQGGERDKRQDMYQERERERGRERCFGQPGVRVWLARQGKMHRTGIRNESAVLRMYRGIIRQGKRTKENRRYLHSGAEGFRVIVRSSYPILSCPIVTLLYRMHTLPLLF